MIEILIGHESLDLDKGQSIDLNFFNDAFNDQALEFDFSWSFSIPMTQKNKRLLGYPFLLDVPYSGQRRIAVEVAIGARQMPGRLIVLKERKSSVEVSLQLNLGSFEVLDERLSEIPLDFGPLIYNLPTDMEGLGQEDLIYPDIEFCLPTIYNGAFYGTSNPTYENYINAYDIDNYQWKRNIDQGGTILNRNALVPQPFLLWILEKGFKKMGLQMTGPWIETELARRLFIYANKSVETMQDAGLYIGSGTGQNQTEPHLNGTHLVDFDSSSGIFDHASDSYTFPAAGSYRITFNFLLKVGNLQNLRLSLRPSGGGAYIWQEIISGSANFAAPGFYELEVELGIVAGQLGIPFVFEFTWSPIGSATDFEIENIYTEFRRISSDLINTFGAFQGWETDGIPEVTFGELLAELKKPPFGLSFQLRPETREIYIFQRNDLLYQTNPLPLDPEDSLEMENEKILPVVLKYEKPDDDALKFDPPIWVTHKVLIQNGEASLVPYDQNLRDVQEIELKMPPFDLFYTIPRLEGEGFSDNFDTNPSAPSLRIGIYRGLYNLRPLATVDDFFRDGWSFQFDDTQNLFKTYSYPWIRFQQNGRRVKATFHLSKGEFSRLKVDRSITFGGHEYISKELRVYLENIQSIIIESDLYQK
ncbi:MAG: hypothetical protein LPK80_11435 [Bacteroidota bacterium]|nr:hypothetical protein [Bacteroidota bacterium]